MLRRSVPDPGRSTAIAIFLFRGTRYVPRRGRPPECGGGLIVRVFVLGVPACGRAGSRIEPPVIPSGAGIESGLPHSLILPHRSRPAYSPREDSSANDSRACGKMRL